VCSGIQRGLLGAHLGALGTAVEHRQRHAAQQQQTARDGWLAHPVRGVRAVIRVTVDCVETNIRNPESGQVGG
jgi:hypothetical protein